MEEENKIAERKQSTKIKKRNLHSKLTLKEVKDFFKYKFTLQKLENKNYIRKLELDKELFIKRGINGKGTKTITN